ncbi:hypothetical protein [Halalkalibacter hemicellulosilyticus]|uniref:hypothetical protein n=1 Tax=Halalkalibacter hemicellulosilyticus TaxID=127886 RepID=UPI000A907DFB|nr:hypothetical protein [Halalkalibacter hemicellulosilyticus]
MKTSNGVGILYLLLSHFYCILYGVGQIHLMNGIKIKVTIADEVVVLLNLVAFLVLETLFVCK